MLLAKPELQQALGAVDVFLQPAGPSVVGTAMADLLHTTAVASHEGAPVTALKTFIEGQRAAYGRLLGHLPADIVQASADECARRSKWFPKVADWLAIAEPLLLERQRWRDRLELMVKAHERPALPAAEPPFDNVKRLRDILAEQEADAANPHRRHNMANTERALAAAEKRTMEPWAREYFDEQARDRQARNDRLGGRRFADVGQQIRHDMQRTREAIAQHDARKNPPPAAPMPNEPPAPPPPKPLDYEGLA